MKTTLMLGVALLTGLFAAAPLARGQDKPAQPEQPPTEKPEQEAPEAKEPAVQHVLMKTSMGDIVLELNREKAPISTENFLSYVDKKFYDNTLFHRVMPGFMIQGGGFTPELDQKKTGPAIKNEWENGLKNEKGTVAMARVGYVPDSATAQFFINTNRNQNLDRPNDGAGYAVFGKVTAGMDVVEKIEKVATTVRETPNKQQLENVPVEPVLIQSVRRITPEEAENHTKKKDSTPEDEPKEQR